MPQFDRRSDYIKSGLRHLRDAEELMQPPTLLPKQEDAARRHLNGAVYLAGYSVECFFKAYIITQEAKRGTPLYLSLARDAINARNARAGLPPIRDICAGGVGHDLNYLFIISKVGDLWSREKRQQFGLCAKWSSEWRYDPKPVVPIYAGEFVTAAGALVNWFSAQI